MRYFLLPILVFLFFITNIHAATFGSVSGFVYNAANGEALIGANVFMQDTNIGSSTNTSGFFSIPRVPVGHFIFVCHYIGFKTFKQKVEIKPGAHIQLKINLEEKVIETQEVVISADSSRTSLRLFNKEISEIKLNPRQINRIPQIAETDLLRSLQTLPGILAISDFSSELYVRGGTPDQNLYLIDGADVYNPEHFFGLFSTFNTDAIKHVEISKGGFGAEYGGRLSSVLSVTNLDGNRQEFEGTASISLLSAKTTLQMPLGKIGSLSGSIRRTYFDKTVAKFIDKIPDYYFYDGHVKAFIDISPANKLTVSSYAGRDDLNFKFKTESDEKPRLEYNWGNTTGSVRWTHIFSPKLFSNFWVTASTFNSVFDFEVINEKNDISDLTFKGNLEHFYSNALGFKFGYEYKNLHGFLKQTFPGGTVDVEHQAKHLALYVQGTWRPSPLLDIEGGIRYNDFRSSAHYRNISPRLSFKYRLTSTINLKSAFGTYQQYLYKIPRTFIVDIWTNADNNYQGSTAHHYILGLQKEVAANFQIEVEGYYKDYQNIYTYSYFFYTDLHPDKFDANGDPIYKSSKGLFDQGNGKSYGLEFLLRKDTGTLTGWASLSLGHTEYKMPGINHGNPFAPRHDRAATVNLIGNMDVRNAWRRLWQRTVHRDRTSWRLGVGLVYASGQPITTTSSIYVSAPLPDQLYDDGLNLYPTARNNFRLPPYARFDISLTMERKYRKWTMSPYLQIFNAGNRKNVWYINYDRRIEDNKLIQEINPVNMLPILPTLGINFKF
ncbi:MAG: TonB-dependent receptor [Calditrichaeota bacterium]|nr:TonB-dependent receptor [Calditrichota bacterium]